MSNFKSIVIGAALYTSATWIFCLVLGVSFIEMSPTIESPNYLPSLGQIGDMFGVFNALVNSLVLCVTLYAIMHQRSDFKEQMRIGKLQLENQISDLRSQEAMNEVQLKHQKAEIQTQERAFNSQIERSAKEHKLRKLEEFAIAVGELQEISHRLPTATSETLAKIEILELMGKIYSRLIKLRIIGRVYAPEFASEYHKIDTEAAEVFKPGLPDLETLTPVQMLMGLQKLGESCEAMLTKVLQTAADLSSELTRYPASTVAEGR